MSHPTWCVEFPVDDDTTQFSDEPTGPAHRTRWLLAVLAALVAAATVVVVAGRPAALSSTVSPPPVVPTNITRTPALVDKHESRGYLSDAIRQILIRTLPGISITFVTPGPHPTVAGTGTPTPRVIDAFYRRLLIQIDITPGSSTAIISSVRSITTGASDVYIVESQHPLTGGAVSISVTAPHRDHVPVQAFRRIADALALH